MKPTRTLAITLAVLAAPGFLSTLRAQFDKRTTAPAIITGSPASLASLPAYDLSEIAEARDLWSADYSYYHVAIEESPPGHFVPCDVASAIAEHTERDPLVVRNTFSGVVHIIYDSRTLFVEDRYTSDVCVLEDGTTKSMWYREPDFDQAWLLPDSRWLTNTQSLRNGIVFSSLRSNSHILDRAPLPAAIITPLALREFISGAPIPRARVRNVEKRGGITAVVEEADVSLSSPIKLYSRRSYDDTIGRPVQIETFVAQPNATDRTVAKVEQEWVVINGVKVQSHITLHSRNYRGEVNPTAILALLPGAHFNDSSIRVPKFKPGPAFTRHPAYPGEIVMTREEGEAFNVEIDDARKVAWQERR